MLAVDEETQLRQGHLPVQVEEVDVADQLRGFVGPYPEGEVLLQEPRGDAPAQEGLGFLRPRSDALHQGREVVAQVVLVLGDEAVEGRPVVLPEATDDAAVGQQGGIDGEEAGLHGA